MLMSDALDGDGIDSRGPLRAASLALPRTLLALVMVSVLSCAGSTPPASRPALPVAAVEQAHLEEHALLLLLADRRTYEPFTLQQSLDGDVELRRALAAAVGWLGDPRGAGLLAVLATDVDLQVRRAAVFSCGELGEKGASGCADTLLRRLDDEDRQTGRLAVEGLAKIGVPFDSILPVLSEMSAEEFLARLVPSLSQWARAGVAVQGWAELGLASSDPQIHALAAHSLTREPQPESRVAIRGLLGDADPWVRSWAARAMGWVGAREDLELLRPLLEDSHLGPAVQALRAAHRLLREGRAAPPAAWRDRLLELFSDPRPAVRHSAIEASAGWLLDRQLEEALKGLAFAEVARDRQLAVLALAAAASPAAELLNARLARHPEAAERAVAARAAGRLGSETLLAELAEDPAAGVRLAALSVYLQRDDASAESQARRALADPDSAVRALAIEWTVDHPVVELRALAPAFSPLRRERGISPFLAGAKSLAARARVEPLERGTAVALLEDLAADQRYLVRRAAIEELGSLGRPRPALGTVDSGRSVSTYRELVLRSRRPREVEIVTSRGKMTVRLECPLAPLTCLNFLQLAGQGYYDDMSWRRVVADFIVQSGDPRSDAAAGPGYTVRDEVNPLRFERGVLGMVLEGPDTAGSQFFITLSRQPHLDGVYTAFGRLVDGELVLDQLVQGDRIVTIREVA